MGGPNSGATEGMGGDGYYVPPPSAAAGGQGAFGRNMVLGGGALQFGSGLFGATSLFGAGSALRDSVGFYGQEASMWEGQAKTWEDLDLSPYYEARAKLYEKQAFTILENAKAEAWGYENNARLKDSEAGLLLQAGEFNRDSYEIDALTAERRTYRQLGSVADKTARLLGTQVVLAAKSGVQRSGSVLEVLMDTVNRAESDLKAITLEGRLDAAKLRLSGDLAYVASIGQAAAAHGEAAGSYTRAGGALMAGSANSTGAMFSAREARDQGYQSILMGTLRAQEARARAAQARMRGYAADREGLNSYLAGIGKIFSGGSSLLGALGSYYTR